MVTTARRLVVGVAWVVGAFLVLCAAPGNCIYLAIDYLERGGSPLPDEVMTAYNVVAFPALVTVVCVVTVMALRGKLLGTRLPNTGDQMEGTEPPTDH